MGVSITILVVILMVPSGVWLVDQHCYRMKMTTFRTTETPEYRFVMKLHKNNTLSSVTRVVQQVPTPLWNLILVQYLQRSNSMKILYNTTMKVCDFWQYIKRFRFVKNVADHLFKQEGTGNMSLKCPLAVGTYVMTNIRVPQETPILKFLYMPNTFFGLYGNVYSQLPNKQLVLKCTYQINGTVIKTC